MVVTLILLLIVIILSFLIYKSVYKNLDYWNNKDVAYKPPKPFVGTYADLFLQKSNLGTATQKIYLEYPEEKMVGTYFGNQPTLLVRDPDLIKLVMAKDFYHFYSRGFNFDYEVEPLELNLFSTSGDYWKVLRQNLNPLFSSHKIKNMFPLIVECGQKFEKELIRTDEPNEIQEVRELMQRFSIDVIGTCAFGLRMDSSSEDANKFRKLGLSIFESSMLRSIKAALRMLVPSIYYLFNLRVNNPEVQVFFIDLVRKVIDMRKGKAVNRFDFIYLLSELQKQGHLKGQSIHNMRSEILKTVELVINDNLMGAQCYIIFAAGYETSATTSSFALYELALNKDIQDRVIDEIDALLLKYDNKITYEMVNEATYLDKVISETLRKYPVLGTIERQCTSKYTFPDSKLVVEEGVRIHLPVLSLHYDPKYYPDPHKFNPDRFTPDAKKERHQFTYLPFGEGQRICIGMRFGRFQMLVGLISFLKNFLVEPCERTASVIQFDPTHFLTAPKNGIWLKIVPREKIA